MTNQEAIRVIESIEYCDNASIEDESCDGYCYCCIGYVSLEEQAEAHKMAIEALEKQIPKSLSGLKSDEKTILSCPNCGANLSVIYYRDGKTSGMKGMDDVPPVAKYCKFCGQRFSESYGV